MRALVYEAPRTMRLRDLAVPGVAADDVLIRVAYSGICGSELSGFLGQNSLRTPPLVFGHEVSGTVAGLGERAAADPELTVGRTVTANPLVTCGRCAYCVTGRQQLCPSRLLLGASLPGCNAEYVVVPHASVVPLPTDLDLRDASMVEPAACALHAVERSGVRPGMSALVVGAGPIGLFVLQVLEQYGVRTRFVAENNRARLAIARAAGAEPVSVGAADAADNPAAEVRGRTSGLGVDVAFDAVGSAATRLACLLSTAAGGAVVAVGLHSDATSLPVNVIVRSELSILGAFAYPVETFRAALRWLHEGRLGLREGVVVAPLDQGPSWYQRLIDGDAAAKVLLTVA